MSDAVQILFYGLLAAASPGALLAALGVLSTRRPRANGAAFAAGFVIGQSVGLLLPLLIGSTTVPSGSSNSTISASFQLAVGLMLLAAAYRARQPRPSPVVGGKSRTAAVLARLAGVTPRTAFSIGIPFGIGVKRLAISILAASTISLAGLSQSEEARLGALYVIVASVLVWLPVALYLIAGKRADDGVSSTKEWLAGNQRKLTFLSWLVLGVLFIVDALIGFVWS